MVFAHTHQPRARGIDRRIGVEPMAWRRERFWRMTRREFVKPLIGKLGVIDGPARHGESATAVLVDASPDVGSLRRHVYDATIGIPLDDDLTTAFVGSAFDPI